jgi:hypothetical protein
MCDARLAGLQEHEQDDSQVISIEGRVSLAGIHLPLDEQNKLHLLHVQLYWGSLVTTEYSRNFDTASLLRVGLAPNKRVLHRGSI